MFPNLTRCSTLTQKRPVTETAVSTGAGRGVGSHLSGHGAVC